MLDTQTFPVYKLLNMSLLLTEYSALGHTVALSVGLIKEKIQNTFPQLL